MGILTDPALIPADRAKIPDDELIGTEVWAKLQGVVIDTFYGQLSKSRARRKWDAEHPEATPTVRPGDIPEADERAGNAPLWYMRTYRAWEERRPGRNSSLGKAGAPGSRGGRGERQMVRLPVECPHCHHEITKGDLDQVDAETRAQFARLRESGVPMGEAGKQLGVDTVTARAWDMARRQAAQALPEAEAKAPRQRRAVSDARRP